MCSVEMQAKVMSTGHKSACDKAGGVRLPGDQSGHTVYTHTDANMVDPRNREKGKRQGNESTFFGHLKWQHT